MKKIYLFCLILSSSAFAQHDPHFSMWQASPSLLNPAATAAMNEDYSFLVNHRLQYLTATADPFMTTSFAGEAKIGKDQLTSGWFGIGLQVMNDQVGRTATSAYYASVPLSYTLELNPTNRFSIGLRPGVINRQQNTSFQTWDNQWNGIAFDQTVITSEPSARKITEFDMGAGLFYNVEAYNGTEFNAGVSINHVNRPNVTYREIINELYPQILFHTGARIHSDKYRFMISPQITAFKQGPVNYLMVGSNIDLILVEGSKRTIFVTEKYLTFGLHYRYSGWLTANFGMKLEAFQFGLAYDAPVTSSRKTTGLFGAAEVYLKYAFQKGQKRRKLR